MLYLQGLSHHHPSHPPHGPTAAKVVAENLKSITGVPWQGNTLGEGWAASWQPSLPTTLIPTEGAWCRMRLGRGESDADQRGSQAQAELP